MLLRALTAFLALPGVIAFAVPLILAQSLALPPRLGFPSASLLLCGCVCLLWCTWAFYASGKGTLAPWSPPEHLVTHGLYGYSRNPMYCGVLLLLFGWAALFESALLLWYSAAVALAFHLRVVRAEEPWLAQAHGEEWRNYSSKVSRWFGRHPQRQSSDA